MEDSNLEYEKFTQKVLELLQLSTIHLHQLQIKRDFSISISLKVNKLTLKLFILSVTIQI